jgi:hypothetical protein
MRFSRSPDPQVGTMPLIFGGRHCSGPHSSVKWCSDSPCSPSRTPHPRTPPSQHRATFPRVGASLLVRGNSPNEKRGSVLRVPRLSLRLGGPGGLGRSSRFPWLEEHFSSVMRGRERGGIGRRRVSSGSNEPMSIVWPCVRVLPECASVGLT